MSDDRFQTFADFYPYDLAEHGNPICRALHYVGTLLGAAMLFAAIASGSWILSPAGVALGYAFSWTGDFFFERNEPATFRHPLWSFAGDWVMLNDALTGRLETVRSAQGRAEVAPPRTAARASRRTMWTGGRDHLPLIRSARAPAFRPGPLRWLYSIS